MNVTINRLDPNVPDPVESRRRAAGRFVRFAYAVIVFGVLGFFIIYFGAPFVYLGGPGTVSSPRYEVSPPYTVQVRKVNVVPGATVKAGEDRTGDFAGAGEHRRNLYAGVGRHQRSHGGAAHQGAGRAGRAGSSALL
jgi:hypothetical protein